MELKFSKFFKAHAFKQANGLNTLIRRQTGIDGASYTPVFVKSKSGTTSKRRLLTTGVFNQAAFVAKFTKDSLSILPNPASYGNGVSYAEIVAYNDKDSPDLSGKHGGTIKVRGPKLFPRTHQEVERTIKLLDPKFEQDLKKEVDKQMKELTKTNIKIHLDL